MNNEGKSPKIVREAEVPTFGPGHDESHYISVPIKQFYRWNYPELWYSFDAKFIRYIGFEGMQAVHKAIEVLNDYFEPQDKSYSGCLLYTSDAADE